MNTTGVSTQELHMRATVWSFTRMTGRPLLESLGAIAVTVLSIVGLAGVDAGTVAAVATIVMGAALLSDRGAFSLAHWRAGEMRTNEAGGMSAKFMAGVAGIVLGLLTFFGGNPSVFLSAAVIVFGAAIFLGGAVSWLLSWSMIFRSAGAAGTWVQEGLWRSHAHSGARLFASLGAITLGIVALCGVSPLILVLVALLSLGLAGLLSGGGLGTKSMQDAQT